MQFTAALVAVFAATVLAAPAPAANSATPTETAPTAATSSAHCGIKEVLKCAAGLGPAGITCVLAAVQEGLDPVADLPCLGSLIADVANPPAACKACF